VDYVNADAWSVGPDAVYRRLATAAVDAVGAAVGDLVGRIVLDAGAATGAVARALGARGAAVVAVDVSAPMVARAPAHRLVGDARRLPLRDGTVAAAVAGLLLSHVDSPARVLRELARVTAAGGAVTVTAFPTEDRRHPVKETVDRVLAAAGYRTPAWYVAFKTEGEPRVGSPDRLAALASGAALDGVRVDRCLVPLAGLDASTLAAWRLGMPPVAAWLSTIGPLRRADIARDAASALAADPPPLPLLVATGHRR
jgi:demethylmenaquinone methyltransferase/2-methoxy-6-polyprenyl-1,4-benzoquinol methylase